MHGPCIEHCIELWVTLSFPSSYPIHTTTPHSHCLEMEPYRSLIVILSIIVPYTSWWLWWDSNIAFVWPYIETWVPKLRRISSIFRCPLTWPQDTWRTFLAEKPVPQICPNRIDENNALRLCRKRYLLVNWNGTNNSKNFADLWKIGLETK